MDLLNSLIHKRSRLKKQGKDLTEITAEIERVKKNGSLDPVPTSNVSTYCTVIDAEGNERTWRCDNKTGELIM